MARMTLAHPQMQNNVSQFGHWNQGNADTYQNCYRNNFSKRYDVTNNNFLIYSSSNARTVTISLSGPISISGLAWEATCRGNSSWVEQASLSYSLSNGALCWANETISIGLHVASLKQTSYVYFLVERSLAAFAMLRGWSQETLLALQMLTEHVRLLHLPFAD